MSAETVPTLPDTQVTGYPLRPDRCVVEVCLRLLGVRLGRVRLRARDGDLLVTGSPPVASIRVELLARPERVGPLTGMLLRHVPRRGRLTFAAVDADLPTGTRTVPLDGDVDVDGGAPWTLPLTVRTVPTEDTAVVLAARGPVRPPGTVRRWRGLWVDAAVEFAR